MEYWKEYKGHNPDIRGKKKRFDNTIYTFDIETSNYLILDGEVIPACDYDNLTHKDQERCIKQSNMYIWMFGINNTVYYGRTWEEFKLFLNRVYECVPELKIIFIHNLSFEFQYLKSVLNIDSVFARAVRKPLKATCKDYNIEFRCSYMMSNCSLAKLPKLFKLPVEKKVGDLDYDKIRNSKTELTDKELGYCEYDCLVLYHYIKYELQTYENVKDIPKTSTGHVRSDLKNKIQTNYAYKKKVRRALNTNPHIFNLLSLECFAGGYTHANYSYTDTVVENVDSWDFTSSYPYCMVAFNKFPLTSFKPINLSSYEDLKCDRFSYLLVVKFTNVRHKYWNTFISKSKCRDVIKPVEDNGRLISAKELTTTITDIDFKLILETYTCEYEILECYYSFCGYLPKEIIDFTLDKYILKTQYKGDPDHELEYTKEKNKFNSIYGMTVTNSIRSDVDLVDGNWLEIPLDNSSIIEKLDEQIKKPFLEFSWGVFVTSIARYNLISNVIKMDEYAVYMDTDSIKARKGYDISIIEEYNKNVLKRLEKASKELNIPLSRFMPEDRYGVKHPLGVFDDDGHYSKFITQGAKKYCYEVVKEKSKIKDLEDYKKKNKMYISYEDEEIIKELHITVSGVPKCGVTCLNGNIENFRDDLVFDHKATNKNILMYCEEQQSIELVDYNGISDIVTDKSGCCILPTTYVLGKSEEYMHLLSMDSSRRAKFVE